MITNDSNIKTILNIGKICGKVTIALRTTSFPYTQYKYKVLYL